MNLRTILCTIVLAFAGLAASIAPAAANSVDLPPGVQDLLSKSSQAWAERKLDDVMTHFHPEFKSIGRDKTAQKSYYEAQLFPYLKQWEHSISSFRQEGNIAHVMLVTKTDKGTFPFPTQLILDNGVWYFYGNRQ